MARLNRETFGRRGPTNVIAFPLDGLVVGEGGQGPVAQASPPVEAPAPSPQPPPPTPYGGLKGPVPLLGEVVISVETTVRQARESGWPWQELLDFFLIHGILHLLGYDHGDPEAEKHMDNKTWELMALLHPKLIVASSQ
jgi:probable rRNA maturation factor